LIAVGNSVNVSTTSAVNCLERPVAEWSNTYAVGRSFSVVNVYRSRTGCYCRRHHRVRVGFYSAHRHTLLQTVGTRTLNSPSYGSNHQMALGELIRAQSPFEVRISNNTLVGLYGICYVTFSGGLL